MSRRDDPLDPKRRRTLGEEARIQADEADAWWDAARQGDEGRLPPGSPTVDVLAPLSADETEALMGDLFGALPVAATGAPRRPRWRRAGAAAAALAVAAGVVAFMLRSPPIPYELSMAGDQVWRSGEAQRAGVPEYERGSRVEVLLRPRAPLAEATDGPEAVLLDDNDQASPWPAPWERGAGGAFRSRAELGRELRLGEGRWRLRIVIGRQRVEQPFRVRPEPTQPNE